MRSISWNTSRRQEPPLFHSHYRSKTLVKSQSPGPSLYCPRAILPNLCFPGLQRLNDVSGLTCRPPGGVSTRMFGLSFFPGALEKSTNTSRSAPGPSCRHHGLSLTCLAKKVGSDLALLDRFPPRTDGRCSVAIGASPRGLPCRVVSGDLAERRAAGSV